MSEQTGDDVLRNPNLKLSIMVSQKILQIPHKINRAVVVAVLDNESVGSVEVIRENVGELTEQARINALLEIMSRLKIPFKLLDRYGNLTPDRIHRKAGE